MLKRTLLLFTFDLTFGTNIHCTPIATRFPLYRFPFNFYPDLLLLCLALHLLTCLDFHMIPLQNVEILNLQI